ncbi:MAG TPA: hypothetical protein VHC48_06655 [Puia sp.]|nr:hypothetical protein [Puia sp.]
MRSVVYGILCSLVFPGICFAQNYHAIEGSPFAGSLGVANNPASILSTPYPWDVTLFSVQEQHSTNAVTLHDFSFLSFGDTITYQWASGYKKRFVAADYNVHLLNARIALDKRQAIAFGANLRGYTVARTGPFNYHDSLQNMNQFFNINPSTVYDGNMTSSTWLELSLTYSRTIVDDESKRINAGITLKGMRGVSGAFAQMAAGGVGRGVSGTQTIYFLKAGSARYGYSSNYDRWKKDKSTMQNLKDLFGNSRPSASMDLGFEYWVKRQAVIRNIEKDDAYYDYEWKIGVALLDVGQNVYKYGTQSRAASNPRSDISDLDLNRKFDSVKTLAQFNDSMATIVNNFGALNGLFKVWNPMRLVINVDRPIQEYWSINGNLSLNMPWNSTPKRFVVKDLSFLTLTPRWEKKKLGAYLPIQITSDGKFWVGGAFKAGPVLFGWHNWANIFSKSKMANGGLYLALVIRPGGGPKEDKEDKRYSCPPY